MNIRNIRVFIVLLLFTFWCMPSSLLAQNGQEQQQQQSPGFDFNFSTIMDSYYYQDALGTALNTQINFTEGNINLDNYELGPNDLITVGIEGPQNIVLRALWVNPQGDIVIPMLGAVNVAGQTLSEAEQTINEASRSIFKNPKANITLERPRPLMVQVTGGVEFPGKHVIPPFSRVDVAIYGAVFEKDKSNNNSENNSVGAQTGTVKLLNAGALSLRNITIIHEDGSSEKADLVAYFRAGNLDKNPIVEYGDRISVPRMTNETPRVSISGAVNQEQELEYSHNDTPALLIEIAGGFTPEADTSKVFVYRRQGGNIQKLEVEEQSWQNFDLQPNDRVIVPTNQDINNSASAWVYGEVNIPGNFPIKNGETTALNLLSLAGDFTNRALPSAGYLIRAGGVENEIPNKFNTQLMKRTSNQLAQGFEYLDLETQISQDKVFVDLTNESQLAKVKIFDGDRLYVPQDEETIFVFGQVNNPGYYPHSGNEANVQDYIQRAGGFALSANEERVFIIKAGSGTWYRPSETDLASGDRIFIDRVPYDELNAKRNYQVQKEQLKNTRVQLIITGLSTIASVITAYAAITR